jgi:hypothetical protein
MGKDVDIAREHNFLNEILTKIQELETDDKIKKELLKRYENRAVTENQKLDRKLLESALIDLLLKDYKNTKDVLGVRLPDSFKVLKVKDLLKLQESRLVEKQIQLNVDVELPDVFNTEVKASENLKTVSNSSQRKQPRHSPKTLVRLLSKFTEETPLKYSTHFWEKNSYDSHNSFIEELTNAFEEYLAETIWLDFDKGFYYQVLFPFLRQNKLGKSQKEYKWGRHNFKLGWQYPSEFWGNLNDEDKEWPFSVSLPNEFRPAKKVDDVRVLKFNHLIEFFKKEIEFRRTDFRDELQKIIANKTDWNFRFTNIESADFYTYTTKVLSAIKRMISNLDRNFKECEFEITDEKEYYLFRFTQIGSFSNVALSDLRKMDVASKKGDFFSIYKELFGFCDWSVVNKFKNGEYISISYLGKGAKVEPKILEKSSLEECDAPNGFTHYLKFYK